MKSFSEIAEGYIQAGFYNEAIKFSNKEIESNPLSPIAFEYRGIANYMLFRIEEAINDLTTAISLDNNNHKALSNRANIYRDRQEYEKALTDYEKALTIAPVNLYYQANMAHLFLLLKNYEKCFYYANSVLNYDVKNYDALFYKACAYSDLKMYTDSIKNFRLILSSHDGNGLIYNGLAFAQTHTGELEDAITNFHKAIEIDPEFAYPWDNLGYVYYLKKQYEKALKLINRSIELDPSNSWAYKNRAIVNLALNKKELAHTDLIYALELGYADIYDDEVNVILSKEFI